MSISNRLAKLLTICFVLGFLIFPLARLAAMPPASRPRVNTEAWDIKDKKQEPQAATLNQIFRLEFGRQHPRKFFATLSSQKGAVGVITQESRQGHSASGIDEARAKSLNKMLADFAIETKYAKPGKYWSCNYPLDFTFSEKTTIRRCHEMLTPAHKKSFAAVINRLSFESKR